MLLQFSQSSPLYPLPPCTQHSSIPPPLNSCPLDVHISSLSPLFPIPFLTSPHLLYTCQLCFLFPIPFLHYSLLPLPIENPPCDNHFSDSIPVLVVFLGFFFSLFFFALSSFVDSREFVVILLFIVFIYFFFLGNSL